MYSWQDFFKLDLKVLTRRLQIACYKFGGAYNHQSYNINSVCLCVCVSVRNRLPNHAYYSDEAFTGDSTGPG